MLYAAKCYWPGVQESEVERVAARIGQVVAGSSGNDVAYLGSLLFADDALVLCMFEAPSRGAVKHVGDRARIPYEHLMNATWIVPDHRHGPRR